MSTFTLNTISSLTFIYNLFHYIICWFVEYCQALGSFNLIFPRFYFDGFKEASILIATSQRFVCHDLLIKHLNCTVLTKIISITNDYVILISASYYIKVRLIIRVCYFDKIYHKLRCQKFLMTNTIIIF